MNHTDTKGTSHERGQKHDPPILMFWNIISNVLCRGRSRGRVQGECTSPPPLRWPAVFWYYWYSAKKKCTMWFIGVEVEQETRAPPPKCSVFVPIFMFVTLRTITPISGVQAHVWIPKGQKWLRNHSKESCYKRLVEQRKHYLSLARKSFKNRESIKRKWEARNVCWKQEVFSQNGRVGIPLEFRCKNFFLLKSVCTWYVFLKSPIHPLKIKWSAPYDHFLHPTAIKLANGYRSLGEGHIV